MAEIGVHGEAITESGRGIDDMKAAAELLIAKLGAASYKANKQAYDTIVPEIVGNIFTNIQMDPLPHLLTDSIICQFFSLRLS